MGDILGNGVGYRLTMWFSDWLGSVHAHRLLGMPVIGICTMVSSPLKPMLLMGFLASVLLGHASASEAEFYALLIAPPTTNGAEARRISIGQFIRELPRAKGSFPAGRSGRRWPVRTARADGSGRRSMGQAGRAHGLPKAT